jgi:RNA recognition motif-containing protein
MRLQYFRGNLFVANLPPDFSDDQLAEAFDPYGMVLSASIARDPATGKRLRYGFVDIATERAAKRAVDAMNGTAIEGHNLDVRISERPSGRNKPNPARVRPAPRSAATRPVPRDHGADQQSPGSAAEFAPRPAPRRQPTFQVERRSLPRRIDFNRGS